MTRCETCVGYNRLRPKQVLDASAVDPCGNCECGECRNGIERLTQIANDAAETIESLRALVAAQMERLREMTEERDAARAEREPR